MRHNTDVFFHLDGKLHGKLVMFTKREQVITANSKGLGYGG